MIDLLIVTIILALAVYRLAQFVCYDDGPGDIFKRLRVWGGVYDLGPNGEPVRAMGRFLHCPYCVSVWFVLPMWVVWQLGEFGRIVVVWVAVMGLVTLFLDRREP